jgi:beta-lactamase superfamily II metal-dependent hydrolase
MFKRTVAVAGSIILVCGLTMGAGNAGAPSGSGDGRLYIHMINVQHGLSVLIVGPNGTTILFDTGGPGERSDRIVPYLRQTGIDRALGYTIISHWHPDHYTGLLKIKEAGIGFGNLYGNSGVPDRLARQLRGSVFGRMSPGWMIDLGWGTRVTCVAAGGKVIGKGSGRDARRSGNSESIALLIQYGGFDCLLTGDLEGGTDKSIRHISLQPDMETPVVKAIMPGGAFPLLGESGVEVLQVGHHGIETSTNAALMNLLSPSLACISAGPFLMGNPQRSVVENVLLARSPRIRVPPALVLQTEEGSSVGSKSSKAGFCVGDIVVSSDGVTCYRVEASGDVRQGPDERDLIPLPVEVRLDEP